VTSAVDGLSTCENGNTKVATLSAHVDVVASTTNAVNKTAQALGPCNAPLAQALQSLERIVMIVDGIADVRPSRLCFVIALLHPRFTPFARLRGWCCLPYTG
jgi:hypothetical protein